MWVLVLQFCLTRTTVPCQDNDLSKHLEEQNVVNAKQIDTDGIRPPSDIRKNHKESSIGFLKEYKLIDYTILVFGAIIILILLFYVFVFIMEIKIRKEKRTCARSDEDTLNSD